MEKKIKPGLFFCIILLTFCTPLFVGKAWSESLLTREKLTGDWAGLRTKMADHGIKNEIRLSQFYQDVTDGGQNTNSEYGGKLDYILSIDGHKLGLWPGFFVTMHAEIQYGDNVLSDAGGLSLPNTAMLYPLPGYDDVAMTGLLFEQALSKNFALAAGKLNVVDLWTMIYPEAGWGLEGFMNINVLAAALPWLRWVNLSVLGAGALVLTDDGKIQGGALVIDTHNSTTTSGFSDLFDDGAGVLGLWRFFFDLYDKPGSLLFAAGTSTRDYASLDKSDWSYDPGVGLAGQTKDDVWTAAVYYQQIFWQANNNPKKKLLLFTGLSISDGDPSFAKWSLNASVEGWGLIPSRDNDRIGVGGYYNELSSDLKDLTSVLGVDLQDTWGVELYYNAQLTPWMHISADVQFTQNQTDDDDTATILGLRAVVDF